MLISGFCCTFVRLFLGEYPTVLASLAGETETMSFITLNWPWNLEMPVPLWQYVGSHHPLLELPSQWCNRQTISCCRKVRVPLLLFYGAVICHWTGLTFWKEGKESFALLKQGKTQCLEARLKACSKGQPSQRLRLLGPCSKTWEGLPSEKKNNLYV